MATTNDSAAAPSAVVLLSGGLDSAVTLAIAKEMGFAPYAISFRYGQRHEVELECARVVAERAGVIEHCVVDVDLGAIGGSAASVASAPKASAVSMPAGGVQPWAIASKNNVPMAVLPSGLKLYH